MKTKIYFLISLFVLINLMGSASSLPNPAAIYCGELGYEYRLEKIGEGQRGICIVKEGKGFDEWDFFYGKVGGEYSYCSKLGYNVETRKEKTNNYETEYAVCIDKFFQTKKISDLIKEDLENDFLSYQEEITLFEKDVVIINKETKLQNNDLPSYFDWRDYNGENWMTSVKNQGQCGSCWAFAIVGVIESMLNIDYNNSDLNFDLSEQQLVSNDDVCCNSCGDCEGGVSSGRVLSYIKNFGIVDEECFSYQAKNAQCNLCSDWRERLFRIESYHKVSDTKEDYKQALLDYGPLVVSVYSSNWYGYSKGIFIDDSNKLADHAVILVGWNDTGQYWIIKNSWGFWWGEKGYIRLSYENNPITRHRQVFGVNQSSANQTLERIEISNCEELQGIRNRLIGGEFFLTKNLQCSETINWNDGKGFEPIGNYGSEFFGVFDGRGHKISNLYIKRLNEYFIGLFGISHAKIINIGLENISINGGGVVGGLVGENNGYISNSYSRGKVSGSGGVGGLVEYNRGIISNSYSTASVFGDNNAGGLVGSKTGSATTLNSFWDTQTSGQNSSAGGAGKTTEEMKNARTFTDVAWSSGLDSPWDFIGNPYDDTGNEDIWDIKSNINEGYPHIVIYDKKFSFIETEPSHKTIRIRDNFKINVLIDTPNEIFAGQFYLNFNSLVLEALNVTEGNFLKQDGADTFPIVKINNSIGKIEFASTRFGTQEGVSGEGTLASIIFRAKNPGLSDLILDNVILSDSGLNEIPVLINNGFVEVKILKGDVNGDCVVNIFDLAAVGLAYGSTPESVNWNENADLNNDGIVNIFDLAIVGLNYGKSC